MANAIAKTRERANLSVRELAHMLGVYPSTVYRLEARPIGKISMDRLRWVSKALKTTPDALLAERVR